MAQAGVFRNFWFWTFSYASQYASNVPFAAGWQLFWMAAPSVVGASFLIWILAGLGLTVFLWKGRQRQHAFFVVGFCLFSFLAVCPGLYFRSHYFILLLPAISLLAGLAVSAAVQWFEKPWLRMLPPLVFFIAFSYSVWQQWDFFLEMDPLTDCRSMYGPNPFPEAIKIADYIKEHSSPTDTIAVLGSEPEIDFYSGRHSATGYVYMYPLMEHQAFAAEMQKAAVAEIEASRPEYVVSVNVSFSWLVQPSSDRYLLTWSQSYVRREYDLVGVVDIAQDTRYVWGAEAATYQPLSQWTVQVFKRKQR